MANNQYSEVVQLLAKQIVGACKNTVDENNRTYLQGTLKNTQISADMISGEFGVSKLREFDMQVGRIAQAKIDSADIDAAQIKNLKVTDADIENLNADKLYAGTIDTSRVTISNEGNDPSFLWNGDGICAFEMYDNGEANPNTYAKFNADGITMVKNSRETLRCSWDEFYMGSLDGSISLTSDDGLIVYDRPYTDGADNRKPLIKIGKHMNGDVEEYGIRFYKTVDGVTNTTLSSDTDGDLWLEGQIVVGAKDDNDSIVIDGENKYIGTRAYASGALGNGWRISGDGEATFNNITARGKLSATVFEYEKISSVGGALYIAPTLIATQKCAVTVAEQNDGNHYRFTFRHGFIGENHESCGMEWAVNDVVSLQGIVEIGGNIYELADVKCFITSFYDAGCYFRTQDTVDAIIIRDSETGERYTGNEISLLGGYVLEGASFVYMGRRVGTQLARRGLYITANEPDSPYIDVHDAVTVVENPKVRLGKLTGISDPRINDGKPLEGYGLYAQDAYLTGTIVANHGNIAGWQINDNTLETEGGTVGLADGSTESRVGDYVIWAGNASPDRAPFSVKKDGTVNATLLDLSNNSVIKESVESALGDIIEGSGVIEVGNKNYVQPTRPTDYKKGDTWQDSNDGYKLYVAKGDTGVPSVDWVSASVSTIKGAGVALDAETGTMMIGSDKSLQISAGGVIDMTGNNSVHIGSGGSVVVEGSEVKIESQSKLHIAAEDLIISGKDSLSFVVEKAQGENSNRVFIQFEEPTGEMQFGDIWMKTGTDEWSDLSDETWADLNDSVWGSYHDADTQTYTWDGNKWQLVVNVGEITHQKTRIDMTEKKISLLATKTELTNVVDRVQRAETKITPEAITNTVTNSTKYQTDIGGINERVTAAELKITDASIIETVTSSESYGDLVKRVKTAESAITADSIVQTVRSHENYQADLDAKTNIITQYYAPDSPKQGNVWVNTGTDTWSDMASKSWNSVDDKVWGYYFNALRATRVWDGATWQVLNDLYDYETKIQQTKDQIALLATKADLAGRVSKSEYNQDSESIKMRVQTVEENSGKAETVTNASMKLDKNGIDMFGGVVNIGAKSSLNIESGGTVNIAAENEDSQITFGDAFSASGDGLTASVGNFTNLFVNGSDVLTADKLGATIKVSGTQPSGHNIIWIKPTSVSSVGYSGETAPARNEIVQLKNGAAKSFTLTNNSSDTLNGGLYTYRIRFQLYLTGDSARESNVKLTVTAQKGSSTSTKITFPTKTFASMKGWTAYDVDLSLESSTNLCANNDEIIVTIKAENVTTSNLFVQSNSTIDLTANDNNATSAVQPCSVYFIT